jgi:hypothetical protein
MSHGTQRLPLNEALELPRRPSRRLWHWCERIALLTMIFFAYVWLQTKIGDWQALVAVAGTPLAVLDGSLSSRLAVWRAGRRTRDRARPAHPSPEAERTPSVAPTFWVAPAPAGFGIVVSGHLGFPLGVAAPPPREDHAFGDGLPVHLPLRGSDLGAGAEMVAPPVGRSQHCVLFAVDVAQFTAAGRDDEVQLAVREALYRLLTGAFKASGIPWGSCVHEDRGDGVIVVIPAHMPTITVVDQLVEQIRVRLRRHNRLASPVAQVRLRLAVHIGEVYRDGHGLAGKAVNHLFRMLDADELRHALRLSESGLALIVSDYVYDSVIHGGPSGVDPSAYSEVTVAVKHFKARAWLLEVPGTE